MSGFCPSPLGRFTHLALTCVDGNFDTVAYEDTPKKIRFIDYIPCASLSSLVSLAWYQTGRFGQSTHTEIVPKERRDRISRQTHCHRDSSTCFKLPNGADRSPDAAWIKLEKWDRLTGEQKEKFPPICPDFVIELLSPSDSFKVAQDKMREYLDNGVRLGLLINRKL